jgi:nucleolar MIF4G domain-containing protein 1
MVEFIMDLKNNKKDRIVNPIQFERLKKSISFYLTSKSTAATEPLGCNLSDLLSANGKWWVVGSAWKGHDNLLAPSSKPVSNRLAKLAQTLKMNTDSRKLVFYTLMSATDFHDATTQLLKLNLKGTPQRDVVRVPLYCLVNEASYNHFYTLVLKRLLLDSRTNQVSFQYAVWDHFKSLSEKQAMNLSQALAGLLSVVPLSILKPLDFTKLSKPQEVLVATYMLTLLKSAKYKEYFGNLDHDGVKSGLLIVLSRVGKDMQDMEMSRKIVEVSQML